MEYKRFHDTIILRLDPGDEVCASVLALAEKEHIRLAEITGLGATDQFTVGVFSPAEKRYYPNAFNGDFEITSLLGTLTTKDGAPYLHLHMNAGDREARIFGGHLTECRISVTAEIVVRCIEGEVDRVPHPDIGVNQIRF